MREFLRGGFVIARRDFSATVLSRAFILFLLAPLFPLAIAGVFGGLTAQTAQDVAQPRVAVIGSSSDFITLLTARQRLQEALPDQRFARLIGYLPEKDAVAQRERLLRETEPPITAVLEGGLDKPQVRGLVGREGATARQLQLLIDTARDMRAAPLRPMGRIEVAQTGRSAAAVANARAISARLAQSVLFILTMLLTTMMLSQMVEEKSNKIIEVLAAAVPVDSIFLGKLLAMLTASLVGLIVWAGAAAVGISLLTNGLMDLPTPSVGWPAFIVLGVLYFSTSYLLLGSIFLGIGAHAATAREVQVISMPITMAQVLVFALSAIAVGDQHSSLAIAVAIFPLSSPYVMFARAAELPDIWPHVIALVWQLLCVVALVRIASKLFRRSVLKSGPSRASRRKPARA